MRINPINMAMPSQLKHSIFCRHDLLVEKPAEQVSFKGIKGAGVGAVVGLAWAGTLALMAGPFLTPALPFILASTSTGAVIGHSAQEDLKKDDDEK